MNLQVAVVCIVIGGVVALVLLALIEIDRWVFARAARRFRHLEKQLLEPRRMFRVERNHFADIDWRWIEQEQSALEKLGFRLLGDATEEPVVGSTEAMMRVLASADGTVTARVMYVRLRRPASFPEAAWEKVSRCVSLSTTFSPHRSISTIGGSWFPFEQLPGHDSAFVKQSPGAEALQELHSTRVQQLASEFATTPLVTTSLEDVIARYAEVDVQRIAYRQKLGGFTLREIMAMRPKTTPAATPARVHRELEALREKERRNDSN